MLVCPFCGSTNYEIIVDVKLHLLPKNNGKFDLDLDFMSELCPDMPIAFTGETSTRTVELKMSDDYKYVKRLEEDDAIVLCMSDECEGREFKIKELIVTEDERVARRSW